MRVYSQSVKSLPVDRIESLAQERLIRVDHSPGTGRMTLTVCNGEHPQYYRIYKVSRTRQRHIDSIDAVQMTLCEDDGFTDAAIEWNGLGHYTLLPAVGIFALAAVIHELIVGRALHYNINQWITLAIILGLFLVLPMLISLRWIRDCRAEIRALKEFWEEAKKKREFVNP